jgi:hypothetical protein
MPPSCYALVRQEDKVPGVQNPVQVTEEGLLFGAK